MLVAAPYYPLAGGARKKSGFSAKAVTNLWRGAAASLDKLSNGFRTTIVCTPLVVIPRSSIVVEYGIMRYFYALTSLYR